ncbi:MAG: Hint domain-containing protein [Candidatus Omnitrophota bacterium]
MKTLKCAIIVVGLVLGLVSVCMAEEWYASVERSSNDYRSSVGSMVREVDGSKFTPRYTSAELHSAKAIADTRAVADSRQVSQANIMIAQARDESRSSAASDNGNNNQNENETRVLSLTPVCPCFAEDTPIVTQEGTKPIAEIKEGDMVLAKDGFMKVQKVILIEGQVPNLAVNGVELVDKHPFIMEGGEVKQAGELKEGDKLFNGVEIISIAKIPDSTKKVYDLEIEGNNYYVNDMLCQSAHISE